MRVHWQSSNDLVALASVSTDVQALIGQVLQGQDQACRDGAAPGRCGSQLRRYSRPPRICREHCRPRDQRRADSPALIVADGDTISYGELYARSQRVAALLYEAGLRRGDGVALVLPNRPEFLEITWGCQLSGLYYSAVNTHFTADEVAYVVDDSEAQGGVHRRVDGRPGVANPRCQRRRRRPCLRRGQPARLALVRGRAGQRR